MALRKAFTYHQLAAARRLARPADACMHSYMQMRAMLWLRRACAGGGASLSGAAALAAAAPVPLGGDPPTVLGAAAAALASGGAAALPAGLAATATAAAQPADGAAAEAVAAQRADVGASGGLGRAQSNEPELQHPAALPAEPDQPSPRPRYRLGVALDACTKLSHYRNAGSSSSSVLGRLTRYFGHADAAAQAAYKQGRLNLPSIIGASPAAAAAYGGDDEEEATCSASLSCSRPSAAASSCPSDVHGVCGGVCMHGIPLRDVFINMPLPENFSYYLLMLDRLVRLRPDLADVYIDFGCRFKGTWLRFVAPREDDLPSSAKDVKIMVNWMHAKGHEASCELTNSGRFTEGAGWRVGEEEEQLWAMSKVRVASACICTACTVCRLHTGATHC
jgi:Kyakuja-Dileera-Zisupton transposase